MTTRLVAASMLSADFGKLEKDVKLVNTSDIDWFHLDIMDGVFVPNISYGFPVIKSIQKYAQKPLDAHLMIVEPDRYFEKFKESGIDTLTIHYEACTHLHRSVHQLKSLGLKAGVALNPHTPVFLLEEIIQDIDMVLIMSVNPGFGGQEFIPNTYEKISRTKELILRKQSNALVQVDGGVNLENAGELYNAGCDVLVAGNAIFNSANPAEYAKKMKMA